MGGITSCSSCAVADKSAAADQTALQVESRTVQRGLACSSTSDPGVWQMNLNTWEFDVFKFDDSQVESAAMWILSTQRGDCSSVETEKQQCFVRSVCAGYLANPYHNKRHALDVMHTTWRIGQSIPWGQIFTEQEQFAFLAAAAAHDIGHFGLANNVLIDMRDELAMHYNDSSPLENMHCNKLFRILADSQSNVFSHLSRQDFCSIRKMVIDVILHTDPLHHHKIKNHMDMLYTGNAQVLSAPSGGRLANTAAELLSNAENKPFISRALLHLADVSNPCKPWEICSAWAQVIIEEFFAQGDKEKQWGLPVGMLNDRSKVNLASAQVGFIQFMVAPFVSSYIRVFRDALNMASILSYNVGQWARIHLEETGIDQSSKVESVRCMFDSGSLLEITDECTLEDVLAIEDVQLADVTDTYDADMPWITAKIEDAEQHHMVIREVRRWREEGGEQSENLERGQHRELVLLYLLSDRKELLNEKDIIMKFNASRTHFHQPEAVKEAEVGEGQSVVTVSVAADNMRTHVDSADFDSLLSALLERQIRQG